MKMTSEHKFTLAVTLLGAVPTAAFSGVVAYWTWRRDQERIRVQTSPVYWDSLDGSRPLANLCGIGIVVTNLSLFPVRILALGFRLDGKHLLAFDRDEINKDANEERWPIELASHARMSAFSSTADWQRLKKQGLHERVNDWSFVAVAKTEGGGRFSSDRWSVKVANRYRRFKSRFRKHS